MTSLAQQDLLSLFKSTARQLVPFLFDYQVDGVANICANKRFLLYDACGLGKTIQALTTLKVIEHLKKVTYTLIVFTTKSAVYRWVEDAKKVGLSDRVVLATGEKDERKLRYRYGKIIITTHKLLLVDFEHISSFVNGDPNNIFLVLDEAHVIKNIQTKTFKRFWSLSLNVYRVLLLTATPLMGKLEETFALFKVCRHDKNRSYAEFKKKYLITKKIVTAYGSFDLVIKYKNLGLFKRELGEIGYGRRVEDVANQLPEVNEILYYIDDFSAEFRKVYGELINGIVYLVKEDKRKNWEHILVSLLRCRQFLEYPVLLTPSLEENPRREALFDLVEEIPGRIIVYTSLSEVAERLAEDLRAFVGKQRRVFLVTGSTKDRVNIFNAFRDCPNGILVGTDAIGFGIDLQFCNQLIVYGTTFSWGKYRQLIGRLRRIGSEYGGIFVYALCFRNTIDEYVYDILKRKGSLVRNIINDKVGVFATEDIRDDIINELLDTLVGNAEKNNAAANGNDQTKNNDDGDDDVVVVNK